MGRNQAVFSGIFVLILLGFLLAAGCTLPGGKLPSTGPGTPGPSATPPPPIEATETGAYLVKLLPSGSPWFPYIEVYPAPYDPYQSVVFHAVNKGTDVMECSHSPPRFSMLDPKDNKTWNYIGVGKAPEGLGNVTYNSLLSLPPGTATAYYTFTVANRTPGTYRVTFDCDYGVARDFLIRGSAVQNQ